MKRSVLSTILVLSSALRAFAGGGMGESAPDFPPGVFSDGARYQVNDFEGKLLVLFFFESECPEAGSDSFDARWASFCGRHCSIY